MTRSQGHKKQEHRALIIDDEAVVGKAIDRILGAVQAGAQRAAPVMAPQLIEQMTQTR